MSDSRDSSRRPISEMVDPDAAYPMDLPRLGQAIIINNIQAEVAGSASDVQALQRAYETVGFDVQVHTDCSYKKMREIRAWIMKEENYEDCNCLIVTVLCHDNEHGDLLERNKTVAWKPSGVQGYPCLLLCMFLLTYPPTLYLQRYTLRYFCQTRLTCYLRMPRYQDTEPTLVTNLDHCTFSKYLQREYMKRPLSSIFKMVRQYMTETVKGEEGMMQCPEERNTLRCNVMFSEYYRTDRKITAVEPEIATVKVEEPAGVPDVGRLTADKPKPPRPSPRASPRPSPRASPTLAPRKLKQKVAQGTPQGSVEHLLKPDLPPKPADGNKGTENHPSASAQLTRASSEKYSSSLLRPEAPPGPYIRVHSAPSGTGDEKQQSIEETTSDQRVNQEVVELSGSTFYGGSLKQLDTTASIKTLQQRKRLVLDLLSTHETGLQYRNFTRITVMPTTGHVIVFSKAPGCDLGFHRYAKSGEMWQKFAGWIPVSCPHKRCDDLLAVVMAGRELLAFSCHVCKMTRICDLETREISTRFYNGKYCPSQMCQGSLGFLYAIHIPGLMRKFKLILLNCVQSMFVVGKLRQLEIKSCASIAYIPDPYRLIAISVISPVPGVQAVCWDTGEQKWQFPGNAHGIIFSEPHDSLLVGQIGKIVVLQTIDFPGLGDIRDLCLYNGELILHHVKDGHKVSYLSIN